MDLTSPIRARSREKIDISTVRDMIQKRKITRSLMRIWILKLIYNPKYKFQNDCIEDF
jgi:hypothetical protein